MAEVSIIVPVYQAESYLGACIDSILCQSFEDFELILVNDGSPDNCGAICGDYALRDSRIRVLHQENQGQAAARNHAMKVASGKWICFVDSDDLIHPRTVEQLYQAVKTTGAAISMCRMLENPELPEDFFRERECRFQKLEMKEPVLTDLFDRDLYPAWVACGKLIPRELIEDYPFTSGRVYEDNEAVCRWVCRGGTLAVTEEELYFYRTNPASTTQRAYSPKKMDYLWALESILRFYRDLGYKEMAARFCDLYVWEAVTQWDQLQQLGMGDKARAIRKVAWKLFVVERIPLPQELLDAMFNAFYPRLHRYYRALGRIWKGR